jgi:hypothetical protein
MDLWLPRTSLHHYARNLRLRVTDSTPWTDPDSGVVAGVASLAATQHATVNSEERPVSLKSRRRRASNVSPLRYSRFFVPDPIMATLSSALDCYRCKSHRRLAGRS